MKKILSILFAALILLSGMHFSKATHICGGEVADVKYSFSGAIGSCGMESDENTCPTQNEVSSNCCQNEVAVYSVDSNYSPSSFEFKVLSKQLAQVFIAPSDYLLRQINFPSATLASVIPPGHIPISAVDLLDICILRI